MKLQRLFAPILLAAASQFAHAAPISPTFTEFGPLPGATFGGSGIPNDAVAITRIMSGMDAITLGLTATPRFSNPAVSNDGAGTFMAGAGSNASPSGLVGALWNFGFYISVDGPGTLADYQFDLLYDFDPGAMTDEMALGSLDLTGAAVAGGIGGGSLLQGSQNLAFGFLAAAVPGIVPPAAGSFDPSATGEYSFALIATDAQGLELGRAAMNVNVPEPGSLALLGLALAVAGARRRRV